MRLIALFGILLLAGCETYFEEQQATVDRQNATRDNRWCESIGIGKTDPRYPNCRIVAAQMRINAASVDTVRAATLLGFAGHALPRNDRLTIDVQ